MGMKRPVVGKKGAAELIRVFAAVTNTDTQEGRGDKVDHSYYATERGAQLGGIGIGVMDSDGTVESRIAVRFEDGQLFLLNQERGQIELGNEEQLAQDVRAKALSKLSPAERRALNLD